MPGGKKKVCYFHAETIGEYYYGPGHPMKPHRLQMTHNLVLAYGLYKKMQCFRPHLATDEELVQFHAEGFHEDHGARRLRSEESRSRVESLTAVGSEICC